MICVGGNIRTKSCSKTFWGNSGKNLSPPQKFAFHAYGCELHIWDRRVGEYITGSTSPVVGINQSIQLKTTSACARNLEMSASPFLTHIITELTVAVVETPLKLQNQGHAKVRDGPGPPKQARSHRGPNFLCPQTLLCPEKYVLNL